MHLKQFFITYNAGLNILYQQAIVSQIHRQTEHDILKCINKIASSFI